MNTGVVPDLGTEDVEMQGPILDPAGIARSIAWRDVVRHHVGEDLQAALLDPPVPSVLPRARRVGEPDDDAGQPEVGDWESPRFSEAQCNVIATVQTLLATGHLRAYGKQAGDDKPWEWIPRADWQRVRSITASLMAWRALFRPLGDTFALHEGEPAWCDVAVVPSPRTVEYGGDEPLPLPLVIPGWVRARQAVIDRKQRPRQSAPSQETPVPDLQRPRPTDTVVRDWMSNRVATWPPDKIAPNQDADFMAATTYFGTTLSRWEFRLVRREIAPEAWRKQGRRKAPKKSAG